MNTFRQLWRDAPLGSKLASFASLLIVAVVAILTIFTVQRERASFREELESQARLILDTLPLTMRDQLYRLELDELQDIATVVSRNENVTGLTIYDAEGKLLVDASQPDPAFSQVVDPLGESLIAGGPEAISFDWQADQLVAGRSIWLGNQPAGAVAIGLSADPLIEKINGLTLQSLLIAAGALLAGMGTAFLAARQITAPLGELAAVTAEMAGGNLEKRVTRQSADEVGRLGDSVNQMAEAIQKRESELRGFAAKLEQTVEERTTELRIKVQELVEANAKLDIARKEAEAATQLKSQFLATMSHELRTPLNAIMGFSQLLLIGATGELTEKQAERIDRIYKNADNLLDLINDLLDLAKIESGRTELIEAAFSLSDWLADIKKKLEGLAVEKGLTFITALDANLPKVIVGDEARLRQIAVNLLSNAIKFTDAGSVSIEINRQSADKWAIVVSDTGIGISSHAQEYIFDEFRQVDGTSMRQHSGTGLGLSIVRNLATLMGGLVRVESEVGVGSTFTVSLPLITPDKKRADNNHKPESKGKSAGS